MSSILSGEGEWSERTQRSGTDIQQLPIRKQERLAVASTVPASAIRTSRILILGEGEITAVERTVAPFQTEEEAKTAFQREMNHVVTGALQVTLLHFSVPQTTITRVIEETEFLPLIEQLMFQLGIPAVNRTIVVTPEKIRLWEMTFDAVFTLAFHMLGRPMPTYDRSWSTHDVYMVMRSVIELSGHCTVPAYTDAGFNA